MNGFSSLDRFKLMLSDRYADLEFIDKDLSQFECAKCSDVALFPFLTNCNHVLCNECAIRVRQRIGTKCSKCKNPITNVDEKDKNLEEKIKHLKMKCIEHKSGCEYIDELYKVKSHFKYHLKSCEKFGRARSEKNKSKSSNGVDDENGNERKVAPENEFEFAGDVISSHSNSENENNLESDSDSSRSDEQINGSSEQNSIKLRKEYNVLLLGQTGVGKSTFVNALASYLKHNQFSDAVQSELEVVIPCRFTIWNDQFEEKKVAFGEENGSDENMGKSEQSCTQKCIKYEFNYNATLIRIFDTPGVGDTRGIEYDKVNVDGILKVLSDYEYLHCICILLKPNEPRLVVTFEYCIKQLLSQLPKSASDNIVFVFTNSRGTFYMPGDTINPLKAILNQVEINPPRVTIPFNKNNVFCLDNETFRFLLSMKQGHSFSDKQKQEFAESWVKSGDECKRMIEYIRDGVENRGMTPHKIKETISIYHARRAVGELAKPLSDIAVNIQDNLKALNEHMEAIKEVKDDLKKHEKLLYIPSVQYKVVNLKNPRTVCGSPKCRKAYKVGNMVKYNYPQVCHNPCYLAEGPKDAIGKEKLRHCVAFKKGTKFCSKCECHYYEHLHVYYKIQVVEKKIVDENVKKLIKAGKKNLEIYEQIVHWLKVKEEDYKDEENKLTKYTAKFAIFLKQNAIVPYNDAFEGYLNQTIDNEKSQSENKFSKSGLEQMMENYKREKEVLENTVGQDQKLEVITAEEVMNIIKELKKMKLIDEILQPGRNGKFREQKTEHFIKQAKHTNDHKEENEEGQSEEDQNDEDDESEGDDGDDQTDSDETEQNKSSFIWDKILNWPWVKMFKNN